MKKPVKRKIKKPDLIQAKLNNRNRKIKRKAKKVKKVKNPLDSVKLTGNAETDSAAGDSAVLKAFKERDKAERERFRLATDSEFWFAVCFQSREQKEAFLKAVEWFEHGDKYLDGWYVAKKLGIDIPEVDIKYNTSSRIDKKLLELT